MNLLFIVIVFIATRCSVGWLILKRTIQPLRLRNVLYDDGCGATGNSWSERRWRLLCYSLFFRSLSNGLKIKRQMSVYHKSKQSNCSGGIAYISKNQWKFIKTPRFETLNWSFMNAIRQIASINDQAHYRFVNREFCKKKCVISW